MGLTTKNKPAPVETPAPSIPKPSDSKIIKTIALNLGEDFSFSIAVAEGSMTIEAKHRDKQAFFLDEIPREFVEDLKVMLQGY